MSDRRYKYEPDYAVAPGRTLQETIDVLGIDETELAARIGLTPEHVGQLIEGVMLISDELAVRLEGVTGVPARMWNNLEKNYREQLARINSTIRPRLKAPHKPLIKFLKDKAEIESPDGFRWQAKKVGKKGCLGSSGT